MAAEAEALLAGTGWLPEPLRTPDADGRARYASDQSGDETRRSHDRRRTAAKRTWVIDDPSATMSRPMKCHAIAAE